jgi:L-threonylcarbamoyladenylate synthase
MASPSEPDFVISAADLEPHGALSEADRRRVAEVLRGRGFVLLPSDTAYSVAAVLLAKATRDSINELLGRPPSIPISMAFPTVAATDRWIAPNPTVARLLVRYCPGPITVVCRAAPGAVPTALLNEGIAGQNRTVGVRIPASVVERDVAGATAYPVTTVAVRNGGGGDVVTSVEGALLAVQAGLARTDFPRWCVVEGNVLYESHSTVVEVTADGRSVRLERLGDIPFDEIRDFVENGTPNDDY